MQSIPLTAGAKRNVIRAARRTGRKVSGLAASLSTCDLVRLRRQARFVPTPTAFGQSRHEEAVPYEFIQAKAEGVGDQIKIFPAMRRADHHRVHLRHVYAVLAHIIGQSDVGFEITRHFLAIIFRRLVIERHAENRMLRLELKLDALLGRNRAQVVGKIGCGGVEIVINFGVVRK